MVEDIEAINRPVGMRRDDNAGVVRIVAVTNERRKDPNSAGFITVPVDHLVFEGTDRVAAAAVEERVNIRMYEPTQTGI